MSHHQALYGVTAIDHTSMYAYPLVGYDEDGTALIEVRPGEIQRQKHCPGGPGRGREYTCLASFGALVDLLASKGWTFEGTYGAGFVWRHYGNLAVVLDFEREFEVAA